MRKLLTVLFLLIGSNAYAQQFVVLKSDVITTSGADCSVATRCLEVDFNNLPGVVSLGVFIDVGTSGTFNFEITLNNTTWVSVSDDINAASSVTADGVSFFTNPGFRKFRVRASAVSGAASVTVIRGWSNLRSTATLAGGSSGDGAIQDGVTAGIEATVADLTNSNPLIVRCASSDGTLMDCGSGAGGGGAAQPDDSALADITGVGFLYDTTPPVVTDGNVGIARMDVDRVLFTKFISAQEVTQSGIWVVDTELMTSAVISDNFVNPTTSGVMSFNMCWDGSAWDRCAAVGATDTELGTALAAADNMSNPTAPWVLVANMVWDGSTWDRAASSLISEFAHDGAMGTLTTVFFTPVGLTAKDFDGTALPGAVGAENDAVLAAASLGGVQYVMVVTEDGAATGQFRLWDGTDTALVNGSGEVLVACSTCSGSGVSHIDNAAFTFGTDDVVPVGYVFDDATPNAVTENRIAAPRMAANRVAYGILRDSAGNERGANVNASNELLVACSTCSGSGVSHVDETAFTPGTSPFVPIGGEVDDIATDSLDEGEAGAVKITGTRALHVNIRDSTAVQVFGNTLTANDNLSNPLIGGIIAYNMVYDGTAWDRWRGEIILASGTNNIGDVDIVTLPIAFNTGASSATTIRTVLASDSPEIALLDGLEGFLDGVEGLLTTISAAETAATGLKYSSVGTTEDEHAVKASAGVLWSVTFTNTNAAARYWRCANAVAGSTTPGTTTPVTDLAIPGNTAASGFTIPFPRGFAFSTALTCWIVTGAADTDVAEVAANEIKALYSFK